MEIVIKRYKNLGNDVVVYSGHAVIEEESVSDSELEAVALSLLDDTVLHGVSRDKIVQKLIDADILDKEMIEEYLEDMKETSNIE